MDSVFTVMDALSSNKTLDMHICLHEIEYELSDVYEYYEERYKTFGDNVV